MEAMDKPFSNNNGEGESSDARLLWSVIMDAHESGLHELARRLQAIATQQQTEEGN